MSRKNRSKFIAFRLKNNQICKAVFVQYDDAQARQITTHQPQPATTATAWTTPAPTPPKASTQPQRIAGQHQRTAEERQHPGERAEGDSSTKAQSQHPGEGEDARQGEDSGQRLHPRKPAQQPRPAGGQRETQPSPADAIPKPVRQQSQRRPGDGRERTERRERREREERPENDSKRAPPSLHPRQSQRPGAPAILPAVPAYTDRGQPRRAPENRGINSAFVEYAELPLTNAAHAIPGGGKARGILYILSATATAKNPPCTHFSTPLNFSPTQNPYITPLVIVLIFCFMIFRLRTRFLYVDHRTFLWISDLPAYILTGGFGKEIAVDYRTESLSYPYKE